MGEMFGVEESAAVVAFGGYKNLMQQADSFDEVAQANDSIPGVKEMKKALGDKGVRGCHPAL